MKKNKYSKPYIESELIETSNLLASSSVNEVNDKKGSGEVFEKERGGGWGNIWKEDNLQDK